VMMVEEAAAREVRTKNGGVTCGRWMMASLGVGCI